MLSSVAGQCALPSDPNECPRQGLSGGKCCTWNLIYNNESIYDINPQSLGNTLCRPMGFAYATWYYQKAIGINQPCLSLTCKEAPCYVKIFVETSPPGNLCVKDSLGGEALCGERSFTTPCFEMKATTVEYSFDCQNGCSESNVAFWYRVNTFTAQPGEDGNDLCNERNVNFPSSLSQLPSKDDPRNNNPRRKVPITDSAAAILPALATILASLFFFIIM